MLLLFWLIVVALTHPPLLHAQNVPIHNLAPPAFFTGSVFYANGGTTNDVDYINLNLREFNGITASIYMQFGRWPSPNATIETADFEVLVDKLNTNQKIIHGEVLVYPNFNLEFLDWWSQQPDSLVESRMYQFIDTMATARKGSIWAWDVVNEVMGDDGNFMDQDGVRTIFWDGRPIKEYQAMGQSYIAKAFVRARSNDRNAMLLLADYGCEEDNPLNNNEKSDRLFRFVTKLKKQRVPIDGVGLQFHLSSIPGAEPNYTRIVLNFQRFRDAGFSIFITEMDVKSYNATSQVKTPTTAMQQAAVQQALVYSRVMKICLNEPACKCLFMWDDAEYNSRLPTKQYSWLQPYRNGNDVPIYWYPSPFWDINPNRFSPKPAWYSMHNALLNFTGVYRLTSMWQPATSYLTRNGTSTTPSSSLILAKLSSRTSSWTSMKWKMERVGVDLYRIGCTWGYGTGYLTRLGLPDPVTSIITPTYQVYVQELQTSWDSQIWHLDYVYNNQYKITNLWGANGTLTRLGQLDQSGAIQPTNGVTLDANNSWTSQIWRLERVWSAGDTKTAADAFWM